MSEIATGATGAWSYRAGAWFAVFGSKATVLLPESQKDQVVALWALVDGGAGFDEVLDGLLASGLSRIPGFVLVSTDDGPTRILLRGQGVEASLTGDGEDVTLDGAASHTWVERTIDGVTALSVTLPDASAADEGEEVPDFPILGGLVRVGRIDRPPVSVAAPVEAPSEVEESDEAGIAPVQVIAEDAADETMVEAPVADEPVADEPAAEEPVVEQSADSLSVPLDVPLVAPVPVPPLGGAHVAPPAIDWDDEEAEERATDEGMAGDAPADVAAQAEADEHASMAETSDDVMVDEPAPFDEEPVTEMMELGSDPLSDPLSDPMPEPIPPVDESMSTDQPEVEPQIEPVADSVGQPDPSGQPAPDGWVTPWDSPAPPAAPVVEEHPLAEPDTPAVPSPAFPPVAGATEIAPAGWTPPPPPPDQPGVADAPPLPIGSWEPVGGSVPPPPAAFGADHDGLTIAGSGEEEAGPAMGIPGQPQAPAVTQPVATLIFSDGQNVIVDRAVLIGRAPEARRFTSTEQPTLITVPSRLHEISSTHVEVRPGTGADHGTAVVTDMGSTNGTVLVQPGLGPEDLKPGIAVQLIPGAIINLGDGITIQVTRP